MHYDPIKNIFGSAVHQSLWLRKILYVLLGILFLREWYVKEALRKLLKKYTDPFAVYDAGSGFGQYSYFIAKHFPLASIYSVDVKTEQIEECNWFFKKCRLNQVTFAVEDLIDAQHTKKFDFILSVDVMEHIHEDMRVFHNFNRALKPNGILFINTPSNLGGSDARSENEKSFIEEHARNGYGTDEIRHKLETAGFQVQSIRFTYGPWGERYWKLALKYPMQMLNRSKIFIIVLPVYYLCMFPIVLPLMFIDFVSDNKTGSGLNVVALKPE